MRRGCRPSRLLRAAKERRICDIPGLVVIPSTANIRRSSKIISADGRSNHLPERNRRILWGLVLLARARSRGP